MTKIEVGSPEEGTPISEDLWGIFFEDINYSADGGLYAELIENRSFAYGPEDAPGWHALTGWEFTISEGGSGDVAVLDSSPLSEASPNFARVTAGAGGARLSNGGFDGIPVRESATLLVSVWARTPHANGTPLRFAVRSGSDADETVSPVTLTQEWQQITAEIVPSFSASDAVFDVIVGASDTVDISEVSLFPADTFRGEPNGFRKDLAEAIERLRPRFVRFPGGCLAHGLGLENMYRWKATIGPVHERGQMFNIWGYHQSMGLGYFEYFRFCEDIGAKPLPVLAAGICCPNSPHGPQPVPEDEMDDYVREVLDLVEFANGSVDSPWGAVRAGLGHAAPFGLEYLGIGNEDEQNDMFFDRFERIYRALREAHPEIVVIGNSGPAPSGSDYDKGWEFARRLDVPIVDEHGYRSPKWYFENLRRFDTYDRNGPAAYLGEYASKGNSMLNALAEAAYMGSMERNGDIVRLASYAPLLAKTGRTQWAPDLIYFDNENVLPTLNYHVQRLFSDYTGDIALRTTVEGAPQFVRNTPGFAGVSVRGENATVQLTSVCIDDGKPIDFTLTAAEGEAVLPLRTDQEDYVVRLTAELAEGENGFSIGFGAVGTPDHFEWRLDSRFNVLLQKSDGHLEDASEPVRFQAETGRPYDLEIHVTGWGRTITCVLDGEVVAEHRDHGRPEERFSATAVRDTRTRRTHVKVVNATPDDTTVTLAVAGGTRRTGARRTVLSSPADAGRAFEIAPAEPREFAVEDLGQPIPVPAFSFTVIHIDE